MCAKATVPGRDDLAFVGCSGICHWSSSIGPGREGEGALELAQTVPYCSSCLCRWRAESSRWRKSSRTEPGHQLDCWSLGLVLQEKEIGNSLAQPIHQYELVLVLMRKLVGRMEGPERRSLNLSRKEAHIVNLVNV